MTGDAVQLLGTRNAVDQFSRLCGHPNRNWTSAFIIGGNWINYYLLPELIKRRIRVKVIEVNRETANKLAARFPDVKVIMGMAPTSGTCKRCAWRIMTWRWRAPISTREPGVFFVCASARCA